LTGAQGLVDENQLGLRIAHARRDLVDLAGAYEVLGIGPITPRFDLTDDARAGGLRQCSELLSFVVETRSVQADVQKQRAFATARPIEQPYLPASGKGI
jgi:hypothetical protein